MAEKVRFGHFEFDPDCGSLRKHGLKVRIPQQSARILAALLQRPGETVTRERIRSMLWGNRTSVEFEQSINAAIKKLRIALGDPADRSTLVERVPGLGYRFIGSAAPLARSEPSGELSAPQGAERRSRWHRWWTVGLAVAGLTAAATFAPWILRSPSPPLGERDRVVIADFENSTGEQVFDGALRQALLIQMGESNYLNIVSEERIASALRSSGRPQAGRLPLDAAREVCQRVGSKAILAGSIGRLENRYYIGLEAFACEGGERLATAYAEAASRDRVLTALSRAVSNVREKLGESLASIRRPREPADVTTPSLDALKIYTLALSERAMGSDPVPYLERATQFDPEFAGAYHILAHVHFRRGEEARAEEAIAKAFALCGRSTERERLAIESAYDVMASGDLEAAIMSGTLAARLYPDDVAARRSAMLANALAGRPDRALPIALSDADTTPEDGISCFNKAFLLIGSRPAKEIRAILDKADSQGIRDELYPYARAVAAALDGDVGAVEREAEAIRGKPGEGHVLMVKAQLAGFSGQLRRARDIARDAVRREVTGAARIVAAVALMKAVFGCDQEAAIQAQTAMRLDRRRRTCAMSALALALAGEKTSAEANLNDLMSRYPRDTLLGEVWVPAVRGAIALKLGNAQAAVEGAEVSKNAATHAWLFYIRGIASLSLAESQKAAADFRKVLDQKEGLFKGTFLYGAVFAYPAAKLGLARALTAAGQIEESRKTYDEFLASWDAADSDLPVLGQAKAERTALDGPHRSTQGRRAASLRRPSP